jgi:hypothetical protein
MSDDELNQPGTITIAISPELGGGGLSLTTRGDYGIAPFGLTFGGIPIEGIATVYELTDDWGKRLQIHKRVHGSLPLAISWLRQKGCDAETAETLAEDYRERRLLIAETVGNDQ